MCTWHSPTSTDGSVKDRFGTARGALHVHRQDSTATKTTGFLEHYQILCLDSVALPRSVTLAHSSTGIARQTRVNNTLIFINNIIYNKRNLLAHLRCASISTIWRLLFQSRGLMLRWNRRMQLFDSRDKHIQSIGISVIDICQLCSTIAQLWTDPVKLWIISRPTIWFKQWNYPSQLKQSTTESPQIVPYLLATWPHACNATRQIRSPHNRCAKNHDDLYSLSNSHRLDRQYR